MVGATESAFDVLMRGSRERSHLPGKWHVEAPVNKKLELKNVIIDWLEKNKLGWEASHAQQQDVGFANCLANMLWMIDGNHKT